MKIKVLVRSVITSYDSIEMEVSEEEMASVKGFSLRTRSILQNRAYLLSRFAGDDSELSIEECDLPELIDC